MNLRHVRTIQGVLASVAALFGVATIFAGTRVLSGSDPGYIVFRPLLVYNTVMGFAYLATGIVAWRTAGRAMYAAAAIFVLNFMVLGAISHLYAQGSAIAAVSIRAMILRTTVWLALFIGLAWISRRDTPDHCHSRR